MSEPPPPSRRRSSAISTATSRIQFSSYFCRGTTNTPSSNCNKGWITGAAEIARHLLHWHECTNLAMETFYECPCTCHGAAFSTMGDLLLHISHEHPQRLSQHERHEQSAAPDELEGDVGDVELDSEDEGLVMVTSRQQSSDGRPSKEIIGVAKRPSSISGERKDSAWYETCTMPTASYECIDMGDEDAKGPFSSLPD